MKKLSKFMLSIVLFGIVFAVMAACSSSRLSAPVIRLNKDLGMISWESVKNADSYEIFENENSIDETEENCYTIQRVEPGTYEYTVRAKNKSGEYEDSKMSNKLEYVITAAPTSITLTLGQERTVRIPEDDSATVTFDVPEGEYEVYVLRTPLLGRDSLSFELSEEYKTLEELNNFSEVIDITEGTTVKLSHPAGTETDVTVGLRNVVTSFTIGSEPSFVRVTSDGEAEVTFSVPQTAMYEIMVEETPAVGRSTIAFAFSGGKTVTLSDVNGFSSVVELSDGDKATVTVGNGFELVFYAEVSEPRSTFELQFDDETFVRIPQSGKAIVVPVLDTETIFELYAVGVDSTETVVIATGENNENVFNLDSGSNFSAIVELTEEQLATGITLQVSVLSGEATEFKMGMRAPLGYFELGLNETAFVRIVNAGCGDVEGTFTAPDGTYELYVNPNAAIGRLTITIKFDDDRTIELNSENDFKAQVEIKNGSTCTVSCFDKETDISFVLGLREFEYDEPAE